MLKHERNDLMHLLTMLESLEKIIIYSDFADTPEAFYEHNEQLNFNAVLTLLMHLGETVAKLSDKLRADSPILEWEKIRSLRHRIAHHYAGVNTAIIFQIVKQQVPTLLAALYQLTEQRLQRGAFDRDEFNVALASDYYRHIDKQKIRH